ncbi:transmembrane protein 208-like isoform X2 [Babylonia areolata]|uniref:transmembrane protein 208-like isoform X2 n=1 Tax=Babylonia areolata TaxID=304850 RepID=UPI003FD3DFAC
MGPKGKQGTRGQKQIVEENKATLSFYRYILIAVNAVFFSVYFLLFWDQFTALPMTMWVVSVAASAGGYQFMASMGRPTFSEGTLVDCGVDLNMEAGMAEHLKDLILLTSIVQTLSLLSNYFWLLLLLVPGRGLYMLWVNILGPWFFAEAPEQPVDDKKAKKMERKMKRLQR